MDGCAARGARGVSGRGAAARRLRAVRRVAAPPAGPSRRGGAGAGVGYTVNLPVPGPSGDDVWCSLSRDVVAPLARSFSPELILVSAGFDAHADDPLATCLVSDDGFAAMAAVVRAVADELGVPL